MRLTSTNGSSVELDIVGYESANRGEIGDDTEPYDWLMIRGRVTGDGREWSFESGCLDTDDGRTLQNWLVAVSKGLIRPGSDGVTGPHLLTFVEPELALRLLVRVGGTSVVRWFFSSDAAPARVSENELMGAYSFDVTVTDENLRLAADNWRHQLDASPPRG